MKGNLNDLCLLKYQSTNESNGGLITEGGGWKDFVLKKRPEYWLKNRYFNTPSQDIVLWKELPPKRGERESHGAFAQL